jgi:hypothetical protein
VPRVPIASSVSRAALVGGAAILLAGCGGGDDRLSKAEWVRQADAICKRVNDRLEQTAQPESLAELVTVLDDGLADVRAALRDLRALEPPADLEEESEAWLGRVEAAADEIEKARDAAKKPDEQALSAALERGTKINDDGNRRARQLGLKDCAEE